MTISGKFVNILGKLVHILGKLVNFRLGTILLVTFSFCHLDSVKEFLRFGRKISAKIG